MRKGLSPSRHKRRRNMAAQSTLKQWHVTFYYLATGMEGIPQESDYGVHSAVTADDAINLAVKLRDGLLSPQDQEWVRGCLTARELKP